MSCGKHIPAAHNDHTRASSVYSSLYSSQVKENHANQPRISLMLEDEEEACPLPLEQVPTRPTQLSSPRQALCIFSSVGLSWEALLDRPSLNSTSWRPRPVGNSNLELLRIQLGGRESRWMGLQWPPAQEWHRWSSHSSCAHSYTILLQGKSIHRPGNYDVIKGSLACSL